MSEFPALRANRYRDTWCGQVLADTRRTPRRASPAGSIAAATTAASSSSTSGIEPGSSSSCSTRTRPARRSQLGHELRAEDVISVSGPVVRRSPETVNPEMPTGEFELRVTDAAQLADAETPPFEIESFSGEVGEEMRLRHRYLDLRREPMQRAIATRAAVAARDARVPRRRGVPRDRDADALALDAGGRARLPRPLAPRARLVLRAAAVAAALQAAPDGRPGSSATTRSLAASATRTSAPIASPTSPSSTSRCRSSRSRTCST